MFYRPRQYVQILHILILALIPNCQKYFVMTVLSTPNNSAIAFWVAQIVSSLYNTCMPFSLSSAIKVRNSAVLFRISKFFATIPLVINYHIYKGMENTQKSITKLYSGMDFT